MPWKKLYLAGLAAGIWGCAAEPTYRQDAAIGHGEESGPAMTADDRPRSENVVGATGKVVVYIDGRPLGSDQLLEPLIEASGGQVLAELVLESQVARELNARGLQIAPERVAAERDQLRQALDPDPNEAERLLARLRERRGLGDTRFHRLLSRNAALRLLVQDEVEVSDAAVREAYELRYGPRYEARLIVTADVATAGQVIQRARAGESFIDLAIAHSSDVSRAQGGLLAPISPADPTYPASIRSALTQLQPGEISEPITIENGLAVLKLERKIDGEAVQFDDVKEALGREVRRQVEQMHMQRLARMLLERADVLILDAGLDQSWNDQKDRMLGQEVQE
jgi:parvulin-like peptidyl-prolyl isomerase